MPTPARVTRTAQSRRPWRRAERRESSPWMASCTLRRGRDSRPPLPSPRTSPSHFASRSWGVARAKVFTGWSVNTRRGPAHEEGKPPRGWNGRRRWTPGQKRLLELAPPGKRACQRRLVREFEVSSHGEALGKPGDADARRFEESLQIERCGLALDVRVGGDNELVYLPVLEALHELADAQLVRAGAVQGRQDAM